MTFSLLLDHSPADESMDVDTHQSLTLPHPSNLKQESKFKRSMKRQSLKAERDLPDVVCTICNICIMDD